DTDIWVRYFFMNDKVVCIMKLGQEPIYILNDKLESTHVAAYDLQTINKYIADAYRFLDLGYRRTMAVSRSNEAQSALDKQFVRFLRSDFKQLNKPAIGIRRFNSDSIHFYVIDTSSRNLVYYLLISEGSKLWYEYYFKDDSLFYVRVIDKIIGGNSSVVALYYFSNNLVVNKMEKEIDKSKILDFVTEAEIIKARGKRLLEERKEMRRSKSK
ncbi:MAG TPA: hypothetical protein VHK91_09590, partial [Flavisolibacter sp.]|nr:hypothetical protein [Flavisolibacter sp.]